VVIEDFAMGTLRFLALLLAFGEREISMAGGKRKIIPSLAVSRWGLFCVYPHTDPYLLLRTLLV